jgi:hypothetical protein
MTRVSWTLVAVLLAGCLSLLAGAVLSDDPVVGTKTHADVIEGISDCRHDPTRIRYSGVSDCPTRLAHRRHVVRGLEGAGAAAMLLAGVTLALGPLRGKWLGSRNPQAP